MTKPTGPQPPTPSLPPRIAALLDLVSRMSEHPGLTARLEHGNWTLNILGVSSIKSTGQDDSDNLNLCRELFGGEATDGGTVSDGLRWSKLRTVWLGVPVQMHFTVTDESDAEAARLRHRIAELEARLGGLPATEGERAELRHQVQDPAVPPPAVALPPVEDSVRVELAAAESAEAIL